MDLLVGSFNHESIYTLTFHPASVSNPKPSLAVVKESPAIGFHSWIALSPPNRSNDRFIYCTVWSSDHPTVAAYRVRQSGRSVDFINAKPVKTISGYTACRGNFIYSVSGQSGEVFLAAPDGGLADLVQEIEFGGKEASNRSNDGHGSFGGLRYGAHSVDLSPDGRALYVADIGRNCIWTFYVNSPTRIGSHFKLGLETDAWNKKEGGQPHLELAQKWIAPRANDGPRHTWPHPNGKVLYSLQEHTSMVDVFALNEDGIVAEHVQGVRILPADRDARDYWADEVRLSRMEDERHRNPQYLYASTRGLRPEVKGYVAAFALKDDGYIVTPKGHRKFEDNTVAALDVWETPTSGGVANAIEPGPWNQDHSGLEYLALTDAEEGFVSILSFDGKQVKEVVRVALGSNDDGQAVKAATAVWL